MDVPLAAADELWQRTALCAAGVQYGGVGSSPARGETTIYNLTPAVAVGMGFFKGRIATAKNASAFFFFFLNKNFNSLEKLF